MNRITALCKEIFDIVDKKGEGLFKKIHIIDNTSTPAASKEDKEYRIYHADGFCFDIKKEQVCDKSEVTGYEGIDENGFTYEFFSSYEGFQYSDEENAIRILKRTLK